MKTLSFLERATLHVSPERVERRAWPIILIRLRHSMKMCQTMCNIIVRSVDEVLLGSGFKKCGATWQRTTSETISVISLQKSRWGDSYYLNHGIWLAVLGNVANPKVHQCHLTKRLSGAKLEAALDLQTELSEAERRKTVRSALKRLVTMLNSCDSACDVAQLVSSGRFKPDLVLASAQSWMARHCMQ
jgi:hypothetical protein